MIVLLLLRLFFIFLPVPHSIQLLLRLCYSTCQLLAKRPANAPDLRRRSQPKPRPAQTKAQKTDQQRTNANTNTDADSSELYSSPISYSILLILLLLTNSLWVIRPSPITFPSRLSYRIILLHFHALSPLLTLPPRRRETSGGLAVPCSDLHDQGKASNHVDTVGV